MIAPLFHLATLAGILASMSSPLTAYRIFASPGGLPKERKACREVIAKYNEAEAMMTNPTGRNAC